MKIKIEDAIPLPENWQDSGIRGNTGYGPMLREMRIGQSFTMDVINKHTQKELANLRQAIYQLRAAKIGRKNFVIRLIDHDHETGHKVYRIWAAPLTHQE